MKITNSTPKQDGYYMPSELARHRCTYMLWPERGDNWRSNAEKAERVFCEVARTIAKYEPVVMCASPREYATALDLNLPGVRVVEMTSNDAWIRDCGATFVINGQGGIRANDFGFNAWGGLVNGLYFPWDQDDLVAAKMANIERADFYRVREFILEGGSIHSDGEGTILTTEECLLDPGRNPGMSKAQIEENLKEYLGAEKVLWLPKGIYMDEDTNGHVDNICQFVAPGKVVLAWEDNENDPQHERSQMAYDYLSQQTDARGRQIEIVKLHVPNPVLITEEESQGVDVTEGTFPRREGDRLPASYVNYYNCNGAVILPVFNDPHDAEAIATLQSLFPDKVIEPIYAREIILGGGNIHCITQQVPEA